MAISIILIIVGFFLLIKGADFLVTGASNIAKRMHIPEIVIGLTIVSIGTSLPELVVSVTSAIKGFQDITIGNVIGSNLANLLLILGLSAFIKPVDIKKSTQDFEIPICLLATLIFAVMCLWKNGITRVEAIILILLFALFIGYTIFITHKTQKKELNIETEETTEKIGKSILIIILGIIALKLGGDLTVNNATNVARILGLSEKIISITILAIGTSLPELVTSVIAAIKGSSDIAIGNIIGSNIFNVLLIVGTSAIVNPIVYNSIYNVDIMILLFSTLLLSFFPIFPPKDKMGRSEGILYMFLYTLYMVISFHA